VREFKKIVGKHGTRAAYWAHASVGVLHVRPLIDVHDPADRAKLLDIAVEVADLARECGGVMSGEHGDGRIRGPLLERFFGPRLMQAFRDVKRVFDPHNLLNPNNIVRPGPVESIVERLRIMPAEAKREIFVPDVDTYFDYSDQHGFHGAVEMCNGAGFCRKTAGGTMCPSYRATLDEQHSTRGRGNALRLAITGQMPGSNDGKPKWDDEGAIETLDLCLSCKACKTECPSNVDIARLKAEYTAQQYRRHRAPLSAKLFGHVRTLNRLGAIAPRLANRVNELPAARRVLNRVMKLAPRRSIPPFATSLYRWVAKRTSSTSSDRPVVILYADCFVAYSEPHIGHAAVEVLEALGYEVRLPKVGCCGRAMISTGLLGDAIRMADHTLTKLLKSLNDTPRVKAMVVCEPSCLSAIKDDWLQLKLKTSLDQRRRVADMSWLVEDFVERFWEGHPNRPGVVAPDAPVILHGHCHQKALWGDRTSADALRRVAGDKLAVLPSGCCGMAGSFGYVEHHYELSMKIGELSVFPPIRKQPDAIVVAPGTSCRHQIRDGTGRHALHPVELIARSITR
jgi:Fe-S oxidoreductase